MILEHCHGCTKIIENKCSVYNDPFKLPTPWLDCGCPFNPPKVEVKKTKVRVGQQKQKRRSR